MANSYKKRSGDRTDGRRIRSINGFSNFIPYVMIDRNDALNYYAESFEISEADRWLREQRTSGYKGMGMLHLFIAAYLRTCAELPGLNRFVAGRRLYAHNDIEVVMALKKNMSVEGDETTIKIPFSPSDTIYDVYRKLNKEVDKVKNSDEDNGTDAFANTMAKLPRFMLQFVLWILRVSDYFGLIPKDLLDVSPFHGSMIITDLGSLGIGPVYHHIYNFGTLPVFIAFGAKRRAYELDRNGNVVEKKYIDAKFTLDERIVDGYYYATAFKLINKYIQNPSLLEVPPEKVKKDIY